MEKKSVYRDLARHLDSFPQGYPSTESGVELEILAALFTEHEARLAALIPLTFISLGELVERSGQSQSDVRNLVQSMAKKGLINLSHEGGVIKAMSLPFVVGFYENQRDSLDRKLARLIDDYFTETGFNLVSITPSFHRVIPVDESIDTRVEILPEDDIVRLLSSKSAWAVVDCICRKQQALLDQACEHPIRTCLIMSDTPHVFERRQDMDSLTLPEALKVLQQAAAAGLVHTVANHKEGLSYVCNCCTCGCGILRGIAEAHLSNVVARSAYKAIVDAETCVGCGECETVCQFGALSVSNIAFADPNTCVGCGVCTRACSEDAIQLTLRPVEDILDIPNAFHDWLKVRSANRNLA